MVADRVPSTGISRDEALERAHRTTSRIGEERLAELARRASLELRSRAFWASLIIAGGTTTVLIASLAAFAHASEISRLIAPLGAGAALPALRYAFEALQESRSTAGPATSDAIVAWQGVLANHHSEDAS